MSSGFLDLAYLIEISIVFNLAYREVKPLFDRHQIENKIQQITNDPEVKNTIEFCKNNSNKLAEGVVVGSHKKFIASAESLSKEQNGLYLIKWINFNMSIVLSILLFATIYQHIPIIKYIADNFEFVWWGLFVVLVLSIAFPIYLTARSNKKIKSIYGTLERDLKEFLDTHNKYLAEKADNQGWK
ncbi:MAG: hypothetical protein HFP81_01855 [Methylococcales symbiont of Hymedesmia sp. n. MRB-2018]|nr:MAG: hypothetical protein HFP78_03215 [Methylococcales symbiont of Hymedesmia sp. n. MRB-2018]KAF3984521.1 MAG: hypothetical protein HFP81_01855 [Methylococcales symbiont of Hymedesmia sp. n. MRB-2018]